MGAVLQVSAQREAIWDEHAAITAAIGSGDAELAARLIDQHGAHASETLLARLGAVLNPPSRNTS
jgi:DNA-binding GntR family transcriptional regulator